MSDDFESFLVQAVRRRAQALFPVASHSPSVRIGENALSGKSLSLPLDDPNDPQKGMRSTHLYVPGSSGVDKTKFLESICRDIIYAGYGLIVLDGKAGEGSLYQNLLDYCARLDFEGRNSRLADKTVLINPDGSSHSVGINYLERLGRTSADALSGLVVEAIKKFYGEDREYQPWLERWLPAALLPLIESGFPLVELFDILDLRDPSFREAILRQMPSDDHRRKWEVLYEFKPMERAAMLSSSMTRADTFRDYQTLKTVFGQTKTTINWLRVMEESGIVLAQLGSTPRVPAKVGNLIGRAIIDQIITMAPERSAYPRRPLFIVCDEFQRFVSRDFANGLDTLRGYGISFVFAHQHRGQFDKEETCEIVRSIDANCRNKVVFAVSRQDAEEMALDLFSGLIHEGAEKIKDEIRQTKFRPVKTYEEITTYSDSTATARSSLMSAGESVMEPPYGDEVIARSSGSSSGENTSHSSGFSTARVPWYDYEEFQEVSSRTYYSIEEVKERFVAWVKNQGDRHAQWKFKDKPPIPIVTPTVKPVIVIEEVRRAFVERVYRGSARSTDEVLREIEERVPRYIEQAVAKAALEREQSLNRNRAIVELSDDDFAGSYDPVK
jgi:hypothetical protein